MSRIELVASCCMLYRKQWADTASHELRSDDVRRSCRFWWVEPPTLWQTWPLMAPCASELPGIAWVLCSHLTVIRLVVGRLPPISRGNDHALFLERWHIYSRKIPGRFVVSSASSALAAQARWCCAVAKVQHHRCLLHVMDQLLDRSLDRGCGFFWVNLAVCMDFLSVANTSILLQLASTSPKWPSIWMSSDIVLVLACSCICSGSMICHCQNLNAQ